MPIKCCIKINIVFTLHRLKRLNALFFPFCKNDESTFRPPTVFTKDFTIVFTNLCLFGLCKAQCFNSPVEFVWFSVCGQVVSAMEAVAAAAVAVGGGGPELCAADTTPTTSPVETAYSGTIYSVATSGMYGLLPCLAMGWPTVQFLRGSTCRIYFEIQSSENSFLFLFE